MIGKIIYKMSRPKQDYTSKRVAKKVPQEIHGLCNALIDQTVDSWKLIHDLKKDPVFNNVESNISDCYTAIRGFCGDKFFAIDIKNGVLQVMDTTDCKEEINKKLSI